jgi:hypothetical protein
MASVCFRAKPEDAVLSRDYRGDLQTLSAGHHIDKSQVSGILHMLKLSQLEVWLSPEARICMDKRRWPR